MHSSEKKLRSFAVELFKINAIKFGEFKTKIGLRTPIYCDLRVLVSHPKVLSALSDLLVSYITEIGTYDLICGVPYTALPIATTISVNLNVPMVMRRKEAKDYGTKKLIEGTYSEGNTCLVIEDVVTSGSSILETVRDLNNAGIRCTDAVVLLNREQGGANILEEHGIKMHALLSLTQLMDILREEKCIENSIVQQVETYLKDSQINSTSLSKTTDINRLKLSYEVRTNFCKNVAAKKLFKIISNKQTNLCVAADMTKSVDLLNIARETGPHICMFKTHIDILEDFSWALIQELQNIANIHKFLLLEDRKFADIGKTVQLQYSEGVYRISSWAHLVTAHSLTGKGILTAIKQVDDLDRAGVFLLAETSAADSLINEEYTKKTLNMVEDCSNLITGIVCQNPLFLDNPGIIQLTPGVQIEASRDGLDQRYNSPEDVVLRQGVDVAVVGRGITHSKDPANAAKNYKQLLWEAYLKRIE